MLPREQKAAELLRHLEPGWDAARTEANVGRLIHRSRRRRALRTGASVTLLASAVLITGVVVGRHPSRAPQVSSSVVRLADGSFVTPRGGAELLLREVSNARVEVALQRGEVQVEVTPNPTREFVIDAGNVRVVVLGTRFDVHRQEQQTYVHVNRGSVRVSWGPRHEHEATLQAGEEGLFPPDSPSANTQLVEPAPQPTDSSEPAPPPEAPPSAPPLTPKGHSHRPPLSRSKPAGDWRPLAQRGEYHQAYLIIEAERERAVTDAVEDLLLAADAARHSGHPREALPFLTRVTSRHRRDARAPLAAFVMGRIYLELDQAAEASRAFEESLKLGAGGALHENAMARLVEAHGRQGNLVAASQSARAYLERYPQGRWVGSVSVYADLE